jgi:hypothetical protein
MIISLTMCYEVYATWRLLTVHWVWSQGKMIVSVFFLSHLLVVQSCCCLAVPIFNIDWRITNDDQGASVHHTAKGRYIDYLFWHYRRCIVNNCSYKLLSCLLAGYAFTMHVVLSMNLRTQGWQVPLCVRFVMSDYQCDPRSRLSGD